MPRSWRARVTGWYTLVLLFVVSSLAIGGWWLLSRTVTDAADRDLFARLQGLHAFIDGMASQTNPQEILDEFREYGELTAGDSLLEVIDPSGQVLVRPAVNWWTAAAALDPTPPGGTPAFRNWRLGDRTLRVVKATVEVNGRTYRATIAVSTVAAQAAVRRFGLVLMALTPAVLFVAGIGGYWISRQALAPVEAIRQAAAAITVEHLDRRLTVPDIDDELRRLVVTFNDMLARLDRAVADIVRFTADASHELRTPVALVRTTAEIAIGRDRSSEEYRHALVEIAGEAARMSTLVDDLLRLARADAGVDEAEHAPVDLRRVVAAVVAETAAVAAAKLVTVEVCQPDEEVLVTGHERSLVRLGRAVMDNAMKYTPPEGRVQVTLVVAPAVASTRSAVLRVSDTGTGVGAGDAPWIFDRFFRGRDARARGFTGSGLGLSLARALAERAGGSIALVTPPVLGGATFEIRLPLS